MKADARASPPPRHARSREKWLRRAAGPVRRLPQRLRERRFWHVQALVFLATGMHYAIEVAGYADPDHALHGFAITIYVIPLLYASLNFGWEGAVMTALWGAFLTSPSIWVWHRSGAVWLTELAQLAITLPVGVLVAWRVDLETKQRLRAERTSASLKLLNEVGELLSHTLEVEKELPHVLGRLLSSLSLDSIWACLEPERAGEDMLVIAEASSRPPPSDSAVTALHVRAASQGEATAAYGRTVVVPLVAEGGVIGSLGVAAAEGEELTGEQVELVTTVAHEMRVAVENARLYRQRQESMRSYVRQVTQAQEDERLRIARELHDETAQELVQLVRKIEKLSVNDGSADELLQLARGTLRSVRRFSSNLRPPVLDDLGLVAAIETATEATDSRLPEGTQLRVTGRARRLDPPLELALFRIAQEALRNVEKHACANRATVDLDFGEDSVRLTIVDDGQGFSAPASISDLARLGKLGLIGMKERAELIDGSFEVQSAPGKGTRVVVSVTLAQPQAT